MNSISVKSDIIWQSFFPVCFCFYNQTLTLDPRQCFLVQSPSILIKGIVLLQSETANDILWTPELTRIDIPHLFRRTTSIFQLFSGYFGYFSLGCAPISILASGVLKSEFFLLRREYYDCINLPLDTIWIQTAMKMKKFHVPIIWMYWFLGIKWNYEEFNALYCCDLKSCKIRFLNIVEEIVIPSFFLNTKHLYWKMRSSHFPKNIMFEYSCLGVFCKFPS